MRNYIAPLIHGGTFEVDFNSLFASTTSPARQLIGRVKNFFDGRTRRAQDFTAQMLVVFCTKTKNDVVRLLYKKRCELRRIETLELQMSSALSASTTKAS